YSPRIVPFEPMHHESLRSLESVGRGPEAEDLAGIRLVATDVDGTLTTGGVIEPEVIGAILRLASVGIEVLPVSGRSAGEVAGLVRYLPAVTRGIAENGLVLLAPDRRPQWLGPAPDRARLKAVAERLNAEHGAGLR